MIRYLAALLAAGLLVGSGAAPMAAETLPYRLDTVAHAGAEAPPAVTLHAIPPDQMTQGSESRGRTIPLIEQGWMLTGALDLPPGSWWIEAVAVGYWSPGRWVIVPSAEDSSAPAERLVMELFPTMPVEAPIRFTEDGEVPAALEVDVAPAAASTVSSESEAEVRPKGTVRCTIEQQRLSCRLPRGFHDLRFKAEGFASIYLWEVRLEGEGRALLPALTLSPGAAVSGFIEMPSVRRIPPGIWVELIPQTTARPGSVVQERLERMRINTVPDERGWFQLRDVEPGTYRLEAGGPGVTTARVPALRVFSRRESILREPVTLSPPLEAEVRIRPSTSPEGELWRLALLPLDALREAVRGRADPTGSWTASHLAPGEYRLQVEDATGAVWRLETVRVAGEEGPFEVDLRPLTLLGTLVDAEGEPVEATVSFEDGSGARLSWPTDAEGAFEGSLPRDGLWEVRVSPGGAPGPGGSLGQALPLEPVWLERPADGNPLAVHLELPATRLEGRVVDEEGEGVPAARVELARVPQDPFGGGPSTPLAVDRIRTTTDGEGSFTIRGLRPGTYSVVALRTARGRVFGDGQSQEATVEMTDGVKTVELEILERPIFRGRVLTPSRGAVVGAKVQVRPHTADPSRVTYVDGRVTDLEGVFEMDVPPGTEAVTVVIDAPGFPTWIERRSWSPGETLELQVRELSGRLTVELQTPPPGALPRVPVLHHEGAWIGLPALNARARIEDLVDGGGRVGQRRRWTHSELAAGRYSICPTIHLDERCVSGYLHPAGETVLTFEAFAGVDGR